MTVLCSVGVFADVLFGFQRPFEGCQEVGQQTILPKSCLRPSTAVSDPVCLMLPGWSVALASRARCRTRSWPPARGWWWSMTQCMGKAQVTGRGSSRSEKCVCTQQVPNVIDDLWDRTVKSSHQVKSIMHDRMKDSGAPTAPLTAMRDCMHVDRQSNPCRAPSCPLPACADPRPPLHPTPPHLYHKAQQPFRDSSTSIGGPLGRAVRQTPAGRAQRGHASLRPRQAVSILIPRSLAAESPCSGWRGRRKGGRSGEQSLDMRWATRWRYAV